ncbi:ribokinase [Xylanimonas protaetiae]|uniref:Ribokinase n=1 Tax=Xylanimonas protaetiae TaxID=2509457 RepID=A0A4V0YG60_9MICO|nr:ribokinase [Xylanimonas protaetiae]QAY70081.1 ribokinase [Xylanimonas protaetiae]
MARIVVVGSVNADLVARVARHPRPGETVLGVDLAVLPGGKGANQAVAAARLGSDVALVGAVGDDAFAPVALSGLAAAGVDTTAVARVPGPTGIALVTVSDDGENAIVVVPGANGSVSPTTVGEHGPALAAAGVVVLQCELPRATVEAAARAARGRVLLNLAPAVALDPDVVRLADPLVVNEHEARGALEVLGAEHPSRPATGRTADDAAVASALVAAGVRSVVLTLGARGALVALQGRDGVEHVQAPRVTAVDTTGAGDAFVGALTHRLAAGDRLLDAVRFANRVGAFAATSVGAQPSYPSAGDTLPGTDA